MSAPLVPSPLDYVGPRKFAFYPPIEDSGLNEWFLRGGTWTEIKVVNAHTGTQMWVPRQYVGGVSDAVDLILVVELTKSLRLGADGVTPTIKTVIEMPHAAALPKTTRRERRKRSKARPAPVIGIRAPEPENTRARLLGQVGLAVVGLCLLAAILAALGTRL